MKLCTLSSQAFALRTQWEAEYVELFAKIEADRASVQIVNALAEWCVQQYTIPSTRDC